MRYRAIFLFLGLIMMISPVLGAQFANPSFNNSNNQDTAHGIYNDGHWYWSFTGPTYGSIGEAQNRTGNNGRTENYYLNIYSYGSSIGQNLSCYQSINLNYTNKISFYWRNFADANSITYANKHPLTLSIDNTVIWTSPINTNYTTYQYAEASISNYTGTHNVYFRMNETNTGVSQYTGFLIDDVYTHHTAPTASFYATPVYGGSPLTVQFTDTSIGEPGIWHWEFNNGQGAISQNPVITFDAPGTYNISLNAINIDGNSWSNKTNYITVNASTPIWYSKNQLNNNPLVGWNIYWNISEWTQYHSSYGILLDWYITENTTDGSYRHHADMYTYGNGNMAILTPSGNIPAVYPSASYGISSVFASYLKNGVTTDYLIGSAELNQTVPTLPTPPKVPPYTPPTPPTPPYSPPNNTTPPTPPTPPNPPNPPTYINNSTDGGLYPMENGTQVVNMSSYTGYTGWINSVVTPVNDTISGAVLYGLSPVSSLRGYIATTNESFVIYSATALNNNFLSSVLNPVFKLLPIKIVFAFLYLGMLNLLTYLLRYR